MRVGRIFLLCIQRVLHEKGRAFVWFLVSLTGNGTMLLFWTAAIRENTVNSPLSLGEVQTYYVLLFVAGSLLMSHVEETVANLDIGKGELSKYLLRPFSYALMRFGEEFPWRLTTGFFGVVGCLAISQFIQITMTRDLQTIVLVVLMSLLALAMSFFFKMLVGFTAFFITSIRGVQDLTEIMILLGAGYVLPIHLFPEAIQRIIFVTPFPYMLYLPVASLIGRFSLSEMIEIIVIQFIWLGILMIIYHYWIGVGVKKFTAVGQ